MDTPFFSFHTLRATLPVTALALALGLAAGPPAHGQTPTDLLAAYEQQAGMTADAARGQRFFTSPHGREWSCASCHGAVPVGEGRHAATGKAIQPMAPRANPRRLTDPAKVEKWFGRNCGDVLGRPCTAGEKADVLAFLTGLQP
jgi:mono/diheme cytochrome c family protein